MARSIEQRGHHVTCVLIETSHKLAAYNYTSKPSALKDAWVRAGGCKQRYPKGQSRTSYQECGCHLKGKNKKNLCVCAQKCPTHFNNESGLALSRVAMRPFSSLGPSHVLLNGTFQRDTVTDPKITLCFPCLYLCIFVGPHLSCAQ